MLQFLRDNYNSNYIKTLQFHCDLNWFHVFLNQCNGVTFFDNKPVVYQVYLHASFGDAGAFGPLVCAQLLGNHFQHLHIMQLEMLNVVIALKVSSQLWANKKVKIFCDNSAEVEVLNTGKTKDPFLVT